MSQLTQIAAVPIRRRADGSWEVLLVTTRETRRWVVPKGWPMTDRPENEAAALEAWEEAGIKGRIHDVPLGTFDYDKRRSLGEVVPIKVKAFALEVLEEFEDWPERAQRQRAWFGLDAAADAVQEEDLKLLLRAIARR